MTLILKYRASHIHRYLVLSLVLIGLSWTVQAQNTKGDRPIKNQKQVRETKVKSYRRKEKGRTRDVAGRRLRTKGESSANRANAKYPQPSPYSRRQRKQPEVAARPRGRVFSKAPRESRRRDWQGDVSGYKLNRVKPSGSDAARNNVYPQSGPYVRYAQKRPKEKPPVYGRTIKGRPFVKHEPRQQERAWKGGANGQPIRVKSVTARHKNVFPQTGPYVRYYKKNQTKREKSVSNRKQVSTNKRLTRQPRTGGSQPAFYPESGSQPFVQRGRKNVYWGKFQKKEKGTTTDLTGGPLRTRNYRSSPAGLVGRDTLKFYGKKPFGDRGGRAQSGGYRTATRKGQRSWKGDISGYPIRRSRSGRAGVQPGLPATEPGLGATWLQKTFGRNFKGVKPKKRGGGSVRRGAWNNGGQAIAGRMGGAGAARAANFQGNIKSYGKGKTFGDQGYGYSGNIKSYGKGKTFGDQGYGYSGRIKRYGKGKTFGDQGLNYSGNIRRYGEGKTFGDQGLNYKGNMKPRRSARLNPQGIGYAGDIKSYGKSKTFGDQGYGYSGNLKRWRLPSYTRQGYGYSGNIKRYGKSKTFSDEGLGYSGNIKRGTVGGFDRQGAGYAGNIKRRRPAKGGGSLSGQLWNNGGQSVSQNRAGEGTVRASRYQGSYKAWQIHPFFTDQGSNYSGNIKAKKREKGGGSVSGKLWNNNNTAINVRTPLGRDARAAGYSGHIKFKRPEKGGGSVSGKLWNNNNQAIVVRTPLRDDARAANYEGKIKLSRFKRNYIQNKNADPLSLKKQRPDETTYRVSGLHVKVREKNYSRKPNAHKNAMPGIAPTRSSVKASEYARSIKQYWDYKRNPNSSKEALKGIAPSKASGRINDYQGNIKMHKYGGGKSHPDAQFAHGYRDNVKGEKTFLMNVKLAWAKLFRKSETQPDNLKEKLSKPKYDKREKGLWND